jgi:hypothetical protein
MHTERQHTSLTSKLLRIGAPNKTIFKSMIRIHQGVRKSLKSNADTGPMAFSEASELYTVMGTV